MIKLKHIKQELCQIYDIDKHKLKYEQYSTPIEIAASMVLMVNESCGGLAGKTIADFGCGSGVLGLATSLFRPSSVMFFDIDADCLKRAEENSRILFDSENNFSFLKIDLQSLLLPFMPKKIFDITVMNPPFGTKHNAGADVRFLKNAIKYSSQYVFSLHKTSTRRHILKVAKEMGVKATLISPIRYNLDRSYGFHKKESVDIEVDFIKFDCRQVVRDDPI